MLPALKRRWTGRLGAKGGRACGGPMGTGWKPLSGAGGSDGFEKSGWAAKSSIFIFELEAGDEGAMRGLRTRVGGDGEDEVEAPVDNVGVSIVDVAGVVGAGGAGVAGGCRGSITWAGVGVTGAGVEGCM